MPQQMWRGWSLGTNVMSMTSDRCPKKEERRWVIHLTNKYIRNWNAYLLSLLTLILSLFCQLALEYGIKFMETSAKANINVENVSSHFFCYCS